eukprot:4319380-Ditylum_brightwellii.AAC.1
MARTHHKALPCSAERPHRSQKLSSPRLHKLSTPKNKRTTLRKTSPKQSSPNEKIYLPNPHNGSNLGEDTTKQDQDSAYGLTTNSDEETKLEFNSTSSTTEHDKQTQPTSNVTSPNSSNDDVNNTTPH